MLPLPAPDRDASRVASPLYGDAAVPVAASVPSGSNLPSAPSLTSGTALVQPVGEQSYSYEAGLLRPKRGYLMWIGVAAVVLVLGIVIAVKSGGKSDAPLQSTSAAAPAAVPSDRGDAPVPAPIPNPTIVTPPQPAAPVVPDAAVAAPAHPETPPQPPVKPAETNPGDEQIVIENPPVTPKEKPTRPVVRKPVRPRERDPEPREPKETPKESASSDAPGWVSIDSDPYATIFVDGKKIGVTPLARIPLPPGPHRVKAVSSQGGTEQSFNVTIESGKEARGKMLAW
jgi:serine/threonine-protein kinase